MLFDWRSGSGGGDTPPRRVKRMASVGRLTAVRVVGLLGILIVFPSITLAEAELLVLADETGRQAWEEIAGAAAEDAVQVDLIEVEGIADIVRADPNYDCDSLKVVCLLIGSSDLNREVPVHLFTDQLGYIRGQVEKNCPGATVAWFPLKLETGEKAERLKNYRNIALGTGLINVLELNEAFELESHFADGQLDSAARQEIAKILMAWYRMVTQ